MTRVKQKEKEKVPLPRSRNHQEIRAMIPGREQSRSGKKEVGRHLTPTPGIKAVGDRQPAPELLRGTVGRTAPAPLSPWPRPPFNPWHLGLCYLIHGDLAGVIPTLYRGRVSWIIQVGTML